MNMKLEKDLRGIMMEIVKVIVEARERKTLDDDGLKDLVSAHSLVDKALISMVARGLLDPVEAEGAIKELASFVKDEARRKKSPAVYEKST